VAQTITGAVRSHYAKIWGRPSKVRSFHYGSHELAVHKWDAETNPWEVNIYATVGASSFAHVGYPASHRFEFFIGLLPAEDAVEKILANVAFFSLREQIRLGPGHTITWTDEPLWPGTTMQSVLVHRTNDELVPVLVVEGDEPVHIEFLDMTLLYPSELAFKQQHSLEALFEHWYTHDVNYADPRRPPEPA
jgi:hypothetical protein